MKIQPFFVTKEYFEGVQCSVQFSKYYQNDTSLTFRQSSFHLLQREKELHFLLFAEMFLRAPLLRVFSHPKTMDINRI